MKAAERLEVPMRKNSQETRLALLEQSIGHIHESIERLEKSIHGGFEVTNHNLAKIEARLDKFNERIWANFYWILGTMASLTGIVIGVMAKGFGWFD